MASGGVVVSQTIELYIKCNGLQNKDTLSKSDPFAVVFLNGGEVGRTETIKDDLSPVFKTPVSMEYLFEEVQSLRIDVYDRDGPGQALSGHERLGSFETKVGTLMGSRGQQVRFYICSNAQSSPSTI